MEAEAPMRLSLPKAAFPWKLLYRILAAFLCGVLAARLAGLLLDGLTAKQRFERAVRFIPAAGPQEKGPSLESDLDAFLNSNLFSLEGEEFPALGLSGEMRLLGTFPPLGALFGRNGSTRAVLVGQKLEGQTLKKVEGTRAILEGTAGTRVLEVFYEGVGGAAPAFVPAPSFPSGRETRGVFDPKRGIRAPSNGQEGTIERDLINKLLMDPYQELNRVRFRPKLGEDGTAQGIEVQWLHKDSLLSAVGMRSGDVIHSLNDIPIRTTADIVNAMNSLLNSDRFVVSFFRDGTDSQVAYSVK
jgi:membrane-associated protease RseP (regulator of RpoE activity)